MAKSHIQQGKSKYKVYKKELFRVKQKWGEIWMTCQFKMLKHLTPTKIEIKNDKLNIEYEYRSKIKLN